MLKQGKTYGDPGAGTILIQITGEEESAFIPNEFGHIVRLSGREDFCLTALPVTDWNLDLSPWEAPAVFGKEGFGGGAQKTLEELTETVRRIREDSNPKAKLHLGGYSLAGLFALWAVTQSEDFEGVAAASPSVWFPGFTQHLEKDPAETVFAYLSLGDREEKTRNPVMGTVGDAIRKTEAILLDQFVETKLEWNPGNHFKEPDLRMAKGFAWLLAQKDLGVYDGKNIRVTDVWGDTVEGEASFSNAAYCAIEFGKCEACLQIDDILIYRSQIKNIELI